MQSPSTKTKISTSITYSTVEYNFTEDDLYPNEYEDFDVEVIPSIFVSIPSLARNDIEETIEIYINKHPIMPSMARECKEIEDLINLGKKYKS